LVAAAVGGRLAVLSHSQVHVANTGEQVHLQCLFTAQYFNLFDHPLLWRKTQLREDVQVSYNYANIAVKHQQE